MVCKTRKANLKHPLCLLWLHKHEFCMEKIHVYIISRRRSKLFHFDYFFLTALFLMPFKKEHNGFSLFIQDLEEKLFLVGLELPPLTSQYQLTSRPHFNAPPLSRQVFLGGILNLYNNEDVIALCCVYVHCILALPLLTEVIAMPSPSWRVLLFSWRAYFRLSSVKEE